ncbi:hypothetical protein Ami103574_09670 [Aminipila butyrica]|uniref:Uncharacterized protein n=1 Tax=Aminipila butyrica TaxID=433296 RepID=A0A858BUG8_9FIRM|nr:hypothetical protein [Aminipila butyrica]QIB69583.1 hypothetical protein Ami103574_09670 [Aminipila butyrica]
MRTFFRGLLIALLLIGGVAGVWTVDVRSGHLAGYEPAIDMALNPVQVEEPGDSFALGYEFTMRVNNPHLLNWINN